MATVRHGLWPAADDHEHLDLPDMPQCAGSRMARRESAAAFFVRDPNHTHAKGARGMSQTETGDLIRPEWVNPQEPWLVEVRPGQWVTATDADRRASFPRAAE